MIVDPLRSCGPMLECLRMGNPPLPGVPGVPPGELAQDGAIRIFGVINVLSDRRRLGKALTTLRKLESGEDGEPPNHQPPSTPESERTPEKGGRKHQCKTTHTCWRAARRVMYIGIWAPEPMVKKVHAILYLPN